MMKKTSNNLTNERKKEAIPIIVSQLKQKFTTIHNHQSVHWNRIRDVTSRSLLLIARAAAGAGADASRGEAAQVRPAPRLPLRSLGASTRPLSRSPHIVRSALHSTPERRENTSRFPSRRTAPKFFGIRTRTIFSFSHWPLRTLSLKKYHCFWFFVKSVWKINLWDNSDFFRLYWLWFYVLFPVQTFGHSKKLSWSEYELLYIVQKLCLSSNWISIINLLKIILNWHSSNWKGDCRKIKACRSKSPELCGFKVSTCHGALNVIISWAFSITGY